MPRKKRAAQIVQLKPHATPGTLPGIVKIVQNQDLREIQWNDRCAQTIAKQYDVQPNQTIVFVNKAGNKSRWLCRFGTQAVFLFPPISAVDDNWQTHAEAMELASAWTDTKEARTVMRSITNEMHMRSDALRQRRKLAKVLAFKRSRK